MNLPRFSFGALLFFMLFVPLFAPRCASPLSAAPLTLSLDDAVERALEKSLDLKKDAIDLAEAQYSARRLWAEIFPSFSLGAGLTFLPSTPLFTEPGFSYREEGLSYSLSFGLSIALNASIHSSMKRIELAYQSELLSYENARRQIEIRVTKNFLSLITMKENIAYMEESLTLAGQKLEQARVARENGMVSELEWLNSRLSVETARYNLVSAQGTYQNALGEFLALLGMEAGTEIDFEGTVEITRLRLNPAELINEYLPQRPDIILQRQTIQNLEHGKNGTLLSSRAPELSLSARWGGGPDSSANRGLSGPFSDSLSGTLSLTIPVDSWIPGTKRNQALRAADAEVEKAKLDLESIEISAKEEIRSLVSNLESGWESLEISRMRADIAERTTEAAEEGFRNGTVEFGELEDTRNALADARQRLLQGKLSCQTLLLDLAAALNVELKTLQEQPENG